jgi:hypothetical protein
MRGGLRRGCGSQNAECGMAVAVIPHSAFDAECGMAVNPHSAFFLITGFFSSISRAVGCAVLPIFFDKG